MIKNGGNIEYLRTGQALTVRIGGEIDHHNAVSIRTGIDRTLTEEQPEEVLLELSGVDFMDSSGLGLIMGRFALVRSYGGKLSVLDPSPAVVRMMALAGMERMLSVKRSGVQKKKEEIKK